MTKLLIGCGVAGLKTLYHHCERLANSKNRDSEQYYYLGIGKDVDDLLFMFGMSMCSLNKGHFRKFVKTVCLDNNVDGNIQPPIFEPLPQDINNCYEIDGEERLKEHWWHQEDGPIYNVCPRNDAQCPVDIYGLTWYNLPEIEKTIQEIIESILRQGNGTSDLTEIYVISSLAGNTGRGCWELVALKVREYLEKRYDLRPRTIGVLYDAMIGRNYFENDGDSFILRCQINALTGFSELSCWQRPLPYRLPSLRSPQNEASDEIVIEHGRGNFVDGPITELRLITDDYKGYKSPYACIKEVADALYFEMENPEIAAGRINDLRPFSSNTASTYGAASFEVDAEMIEEYCLKSAHELFIGQINNSNDDISPYVNQFFDILPIDRPVRDIDDIRPHGSDSLLQRFASALVENAQPMLYHLRSELSKMDREEALREVRRIIAPRDFFNLHKIAKEILQSLGLEDIHAFVNEFSLKVMHGEGEQAASLGRLRAFLEELNAVLRKAFRELPNEIAPFIRTEQAIADFSKRTLPEVVTFRPRFNEHEIEKLVSPFSGIVVDQLLANNYYEMRREVEAIIEKTQWEVSKLLTHVERIQRSFQSHIASFKVDIDDVFISPDSNVFEAIQCYAKDAPHRILKPIVRSKEDFAALMLGNFTCPDTGAFLEHLINDMSYSYMEDFLNGQVRLCPGFVETNFSFMKVLENNLKYWNWAIKNQHNESPDKFAETKEFFRKNLGTEPDNKGILQLKEIKASITLTLADSVSPNPDLFRDAELFSDLAIMVPFEQDCEDIKHILHDKLDKGISISVCGLSNPASSPFGYFAFCDTRVTSKGHRVFDSFRSLDYYKDRDVAEKLQEVEREDGMTIFTTDYDLRGLGYISPIYVRDKEWSDCRWKPWVGDKE